MKAKLLMWLHLFGFDVLLLGLVEKLLLAWSKKIGVLKERAERSLSQATSTTESREL